MNLLSISLRAGVTDANCIGGRNMTANNARPLEWRKTMFRKNRSAAPAHRSRKRIYFRLNMHRNGLPPQEHQPTDSPSPPEIHVDSKRVTKIALSRLNSIADFFVLKSKLKSPGRLSIPKISRLQETRQGQL